MMKRFKRFSLAARRLLKKLQWVFASHRYSTLTEQARGDFNHRTFMRDIPRDRVPRTPFSVHCSGKAVLRRLGALV